MAFLCALCKDETKAPRTLADAIADYVSSSIKSIRSLCRGGGSASGSIVSALELVLDLPSARADSHHMGRLTKDTIFR